MCRAWRETPAAFVLLLSVGLRRGEALGLRWSDVDWERGVLDIAQSLKKVGSTVILGEVKTERSRRRVNVPAEMLELLSEHELRQRAERTAAGRAWRESGLVFTALTGGPLDASNFRRAFDGVCVQAGLAGRHPHELRHSAASIMLAQGARSRSSPESSGIPRSASPPTSTATCSTRSVSRRRPTPIEHAEVGVPDRARTLPPVPARSPAAAPLVRAGSREGEATVIDLTIYMRPTASAAQVAAVRALLEETPEVTAVLYRDPEESLELARVAFEHVDAGFRQEPLDRLTLTSVPTRFECSVAAPEHAEQLARRFRTGFSGVYTVTTTPTPPDDTGQM